MNVLLVGHAGVYNRGCGSIIRSSILMIQEAFPDLKVVLASFDYKNDEKFDFGFPVKVVCHYNRWIGRKGVRYRIITKLGKLICKNLLWELFFLPLEKHVKEADIVISIGGDNYSEDYGLRFLETFIGLNEFVGRRRKKLIIWGASIGPFSTKGLKAGIIKSLNSVTHITVRESITWDYLKELGLNNITLVSDPAFLLPIQTVKLPDFIEHKTRFTLGFNLSSLLLDYIPQKSKGNFYSEAVTFLSELLLNAGINVVLLPHVVDKTGGCSDDYAYLKKIYDKLPHKERVFLVPQDYNSKQFKFVISRCDLFIGSRTHTTISALSSGVPTITIGYSRKSEGINKDIFGHNDFVLSIKNFSANDLLIKYKLIKERQNEIKSYLQDVIPNIKKRSYLNVEVLKEVISSNN